MLVKFEPIMEVLDNLYDQEAEKLNHINPASKRSEDVLNSIHDTNLIIGRMEILLRAKREIEVVSKVKESR